MTGWYIHIFISRGLIEDNERKIYIEPYEGKVSCIKNTRAHYENNQTQVNMRIRSPLLVLFLPCSFITFLLPPCHLLLTSLLPSYLLVAFLPCSFHVPLLPSSYLLVIFFLPPCCLLIFLLLFCLVPSMFLYYLLFTSLLSSCYFLVFFLPCYFAPFFC